MTHARDLNMCTIQADEFTHLHGREFEIVCVHEHNHANGSIRDGEEQIGHGNDDKRHQLQ